MDTPTTLLNPISLAVQPSAEPQHSGALPFKRFEQQVARDVDERADRIFQELNALTAEVYASVYQAKARLLNMLQEEVQVMFTQILTKEDAWRMPSLADAGMQIPAILKQQLEASLVQPALNTPSLSSLSSTMHPATPAADDSASSPLQPAKEEAKAQSDSEPALVYEGAVLLKVNAGGSVRRSLQFVHALGQLPQLTVLRLMGDQREEIEVWVGLRQPTPLKELVGQMPGVGRVAPETSLKGEPQLAVWLKA